MKVQFITFLLVTLVSLGAFAQVPKTGATIKLNTYEVTLTNGSSEIIHAELIRSVRFAKGRIENLEIQEIDGVKADIRKNDENPDQYHITLTAETSAIGNHAMIIRAIGKDAYEVRTVMLILTVNEAKAMANSNE